MKVIAFIEPPQGEVIQTILRGHQSGAMVGGLWHASRRHRAKTVGSTTRTKIRTAGRPLPTAPGTYVRGHRHLPSDFLILPDAGRPVGGSYVRPHPPRLAV